MTMKKTRELLISEKIIVLRKNKKFKDKVYSINGPRVKSLENENKYERIFKIIVDSTSFLPKFSNFKERCRYIMGLIDRPLNCEICDSYIELGNRKFRNIGISNKGRTCSLPCDNKLRQKENRLPALGPHIFKEGSIEKILKGMKKYRDSHSQKGISYEKRYGKKRAKEIKEKMSKNANRDNNGFYSGNREKIKNPFNGREILLLSSMEKCFVEFMERNKIYFNKTILKIKYFNPIKKCYLYYNPDFLFKRNGKVYIVEIKPLGALKDTDYDLNIVNREKMRTLKSFCKKHNIIGLTFNKRDLKRDDSVTLSEIDKCKRDNFRKIRL